MIKLISIAYLLVWVAVFIGIMIYLIVTRKAKWSYRQKNYTKCVKATVVDVLVHRGRRGSIGYKPIFKVVEPWGEIIIDTAYYTKHEFQVGSVVELLVNPNNYKEFMYKNDKYNAGKRGDILLCIMPLVPIVYILIMIWGNK